MPIIHACVQDLILDGLWDTINQRYFTPPGPPPHAFIEIDSRILKVLKRRLKAQQQRLTSHP